MAGILKGTGGSGRRRSGGLLKGTNPNYGKSTGGGKEKGGRVQKKAELDKQVRKSEQLGVGEKAKKIATEKAVNPVLKALEVLDYGRAAAVSGLGELGDAMGMGQEGDKASFEDFKKQLNRRQGVGDYIQEMNGGKGTGNKWADRALGFVGDVALDPLTYVTFGAGSVGKAGVTMGAKEVARKLVEQGLTKEADKVLKQGTKAMSKQAAKDAGLRQGAQVGVGKAKVMVPGTDAVARVLGKVTGPVRGAGYDTKTAGKIRKALSSIPESAANADAPHKKLLFEDSYRAARSQAKGARAQGAAELNELAKKFGRVDGRAVLAALEGAPTNDPQVQAAADAMRQWYTTMADRMDEATAGVRAIGRRENYAPWMMTKQFKELMGETAGSRFSARKAPMEKRRTKADEGATWFGQELKGNAAQRRAQMEKIAKEHFGDDFEAFIDNPWELAQRYLNGVERYMTNHGATKQLKDSALAVDPLRKEVRIAGAQKKYDKAAKEIDAITRKVELEEAKLGVVNERKGNLQDQVDVRTANADELGAEGLAARRGANAAGFEAADAEDTVARLANEPLDELPPPDVATKEGAIRLGEQVLNKIPERIGGANRKELIEAELTRFRDEWRKKGKPDWNKQQEKTFRQYATEAVDRRPQELKERVDGLTEQLAEAQASGAGKRIKAVQTQLDAAKREMEGLTTKPNPQHEQFVKTVQDLKRDLDHTMAEADEIRRLNELALRQIEEDAGAAAGRRLRLVEEIAHERRRAKELFEARDREVAAGNETLAAIAELEAVAADHIARAAELGTKKISLEEGIRKLKMTKMVDAVEEMHQMGLTKFAGGRWTEEWVANAVKELADFNARGGTGAFLKTFDWVQSRWKAYALLTPGFHIRNFMGGVFNNSLGDVSMGSYNKFLTIHNQYRKGGLEGIKDEKLRGAYSEMLKRGVFGDSNVRDIADIAGNATGGGLLGPGMRKVDPTSTENAVLALNRRAGGGVESLLRGPLFLDRILRGQSPDEAYQAVVKYHFDYDDLSKIERDVARRLVPFYTWTRKNFPLQVESMLQKPGKYTRFLHAKRNLERDTEEEPVTPKYFGSLMAIRLPIKTKGGDQMYWSPDLPFRDLAEQFSMGTLLGQGTPLIKTPVEVATKKKIYEEFVPMSDRLEPAPESPGWKQIIPLLEKLDGKYGLPKVHKNRDGEYLMEEAQVHKINELIPLLARVRRLAPSEEKYQARQMTTAISVFTGQSMQTNTKDAQAGELARRVREVIELNKRTKQLQEPKK